MRDLLEDLRRALAHASERKTDVRRFGFGTRDLIIHGTPELADAMPEGNLIEAATSQLDAPAVALHLIERSAADSLRFPATALSAYGALRQSIGTGWIVLHNPDTARVLALDTVTRAALYHPGASVPARDRAEFCRPLLHWLAILEGNVVIHAGAVARDGLALIVAGEGNAGKTTLIRACLASGFSMLGDNVVEVTRADRGPSQVVGVYPTLKVRPDAVVPPPSEWPPPQWDDEAAKHIYSLAGTLGGGFTRIPQQIARVLVLNPAGPVTPATLPLAAAVFKVAPNTVGQFPLFEEEVLRRTGSVLGRLAVVTAGRVPPSDIPRMVDSLLAERHGGDERKGYP